MTRLAEERGAIGVPITITKMRILYMVANQGPNTLFCMPNRTNCILKVSVMNAIQWTDGSMGRPRLRAHSPSLCAEQTVRRGVHGSTYIHTDRQT
jgi:hypothetical protein